MRRPLALLFRQAARVSPLALKTLLFLFRGEQRASDAQPFTASTSPTDYHPPAMPTTFPCPYLNATVELTEEREAHVVRLHPDLLPDQLDLIRATLSDPNTIHQSRRDTLIFARWYDRLYGGKYFLRRRER